MGQWLGAAACIRLGRREVSATDQNPVFNNHSSTRSPMHGGVAGTAKRNEVFLRILSGLTAKLPMVNFESRQRAATLASPTVRTQHLLAQSFVQPESETQAGSLDLVRRSAWVRDCVPATVTSVTECT